MSHLTVPSSIISPNSEATLTPAMVSTLWEIAHALDAKRVPAIVDNAVWLEIPTTELRGPEGRTDNVHLRKLLKRLSRIEIEGAYRGEPWAAMMIAEWHIIKAGTLARILVPPAAVKALRSAETFAKIEKTAAHKLPPHARRLYGLLADKKRLGKPEWTFELDQLRELMGVADKKTYARWDAFQKWVLIPAVTGVNDYGTVTVTMTPIRRGRPIYAVKFEWVWKTVDAAQETVEENERHSSARRKSPPVEADAPPLVEAEQIPVKRRAFMEDPAPIDPEDKVDPKEVSQLIERLNGQMMTD